MTEHYSSKVEERIATAAPFAQPVLSHLRNLVHQAVPEVTEDIKWGHISFLLDGKIFCGLGSFKQHCSFGFWKNEIQQEIAAMGYDCASAMGLFGKITSIQDLPSKKDLLALIQKAAVLARTATVPKKRPSPKPELPVPEELAVALKRSRLAAKHFAAFTPAMRREYLVWISEAKREETRKQRIAQTVEWVAEGKQRNWKYQNC